MQHPATIHQLRAVVASSDHPAAGACLLVIDKILAGADPRDMLGLRCAPGQHSLATRLRRDRRDSLLRELAHRHFRETPVAAQVRAITTEWKAYCRNARAIDAALPAMPAGYSDKPRAVLFEVARLGVKFPDAKQLANILKKGNLLPMHFSREPSDIQSSHRKDAKC